MNAIMPVVERLNQGGYLFLVSLFSVFLVVIILVNLIALLLTAAVKLLTLTLK